MIVQFSLKFKDSLIGSYKGTAHCNQKLGSILCHCIYTLFTLHVHSFGSDNALLLISWKKKHFDLIECTKFRAWREAECSILCQSFI